MAKVAAFLRISSPVLFRYLNASQVVAVGGGYLGDQYKAETILTCWTWWWASRIGVPVMTMPVSFEVRGRFLTAFVRLTSQQVVWHARDQASVQALRRSGLNVQFAPDLAFLNFNEEAARRTVPIQGVVGVSLVGTDYLTSEQLHALTDALRDAFEARPGALTKIIAVSMHRKILGTDVGNDEAATLQLIEKVNIPVEIVNATTYADVCAALARADLVLSARMHAGIAALCGGIRVGLLAYEEKHLALMRDLGLPQYAVPISAPSERIDQLVGDLIAAPREPFIAAAADRRKQLFELGLASD